MSTWANCILAYYLVTSCWPMTRPQRFKLWCPCRHVLTWRKSDVNMTLSTCQDVEHRMSTWANRILTCYLANSLWQTTSNTTVHVYLLEFHFNIENGVNFMKKENLHVNMKNALCRMGHRLLWWLLSGCRYLSGMIMMSEWIAFFLSGRYQRGKVAHHDLWS